MVSVRKVPQRTCVGCGKVLPKKELVRIVRTPDNQVVVDKTSKKPGRGAYICPREECLDRAVKQGRISKSLEVEIPPDVVLELSKQLSGDDE